MGHDARNASLSAQQLEHLWEEHLKGEFDIKDVEATLYHGRRCLRQPHAGEHRGPREERASGVLSRRLPSLVA